MLNFLKPKIIYVKIYKNRFTVKTVGHSPSQTTETSPQPFSADNSPPSNVKPIAAAIMQEIETAHTLSKLRTPNVVMHVIDMAGPSLSKDENGLLIELKNQISGCRVLILTEKHQELSDAEVRLLE